MRNTILLAMFTLSYLCSFAIYSAKPQDFVPPKTAADYIQLLQTNQISLQDYSFIVSKSNIHPAYTEVESGDIAEDESKRTIKSVLESPGRLSQQQVESAQINELLNQIELASYTLNGSLYQFKGIGQSIWKYAFVALKTPYESVMREQLNQKNNEEKLDEIIDPFFP